MNTRWVVETALFLALAFSVILSSKVFGAEASSTGSSGGSKSSPSEYSWGLMIGGGIHAGTLGESLAPMPLYFGEIPYQRNQGFLRPGFYFAIQNIKTQADFLGSQTALDMLTVGGGVQLYVFPLSEGRMAPFLGVQGYAQRGSLLLDNPPEGYTDFSRPNLYGYEISVGFDLQRQNISKFRLKLGYSVDSLKVGTLSSVNSTSFRISLGL
jgi:hypothetical protein